MAAQTVSAFVASIPDLLDKGTEWTDRLIPDWARPLDAYRRLEVSPEAPGNIQAKYSELRIKREARIQRFEEKRIPAIETELSGMRLGIGMLEDRIQKREKEGGWLDQFKAKRRQAEKDRKTEDERRYQRIITNIAVQLANFREDLKKRKERVRTLERRRSLLQDALVTFQREILRLEEAYEKIATPEKRKEYDQTWSQAWNQHVNQILNKSRDFRDWITGKPKHDVFDLKIHIPASLRAVVPSVARLEDAVPGFITLNPAKDEITFRLTQELFAGLLQHAQGTPLF